MYPILRCDRLLGGMPRPLLWKPRNNAFRFTPPSSVCHILTTEWGISLGSIAYACVALGNSLPFSEFPIPYLGDEGVEDNDSQGSTYLRNKMEKKRP